MRNGDISNELSKRVLVVSDVFLDIDMTVKRVFKFIPIVKMDKKIRRDILSMLYLYTVNKGVTLELVSFNLDEEQLSDVVDQLDRLGTNPFRYFSAYSSSNQLVSELPYRPEVTGVLDVPKNLLRYGHWGMDFNSL